MYKFTFENKKYQSDGEDIRLLVVAINRDYNSEQLQRFEQALYLGNSYDIVNHSKAMTVLKKIVGKEYDINAILVRSGFTKDAKLTFSEQTKWSN